MAPSASAPHKLNGILFVSFPTWIYYRNGKRYVVDTPADLATQPPGHGRSPGGPWLDGLEGKVPWEFGQAPFAPAHYATPLRYGTELVCASKLLIYAGRALCRGQLVDRSWSLEDEDLLQAYEVGPVRFDHRSARHEPTGWYFVDAATRDAYARLYEAGDITGWVPPVVTAGATPVVRCEKGASAVRGRPSRRAHEEKLLDFLDAVEEYIKGYRVKITDHYPTIKEIRHGVRPPSTAMHAKTFGRWGRDTLELINSPYREIKTWMTSLPY